MPEHLVRRRDLVWPLYHCRRSGHVRPSSNRCVVAKREKERGSLSRFGLDPYSPAMAVENTLDVGKSDSAPRNRWIAMKPFERPKHLLGIFLFKSNSIISNKETGSIN